MNIKKIQDAVELIKKDFKDSPKEFQEYNKKRFENAKKAGAPTQVLNDGREIISNFEGMDVEQYEKSMKPVDKKYEDVIEKQKEIEQYNSEKAGEKIAEVDWYPIKLSYFNENIKPEDMPQELIDLIVDDEE